MTIIAQTNCKEFFIQFNGSSTYFITDSNGECWGSFSTERKARNSYNRILKAQGIS